MPLIQSRGPWTRLPPLSAPISPALRSTLSPFKNSGYGGDGLRLFLTAQNDFQAHPVMPHGPTPTVSWATPTRASTPWGPAWHISDGVLSFTNWGTENGADQGPQDWWIQYTALCVIIPTGDGGTGWTRTYWDTADTGHWSIRTLHYANASHHFTVRDSAPYNAPDITGIPDGHPRIVICRGNGSRIATDTNFGSSSAASGGTNWRSGFSQWTFGMRSHTGQPTSDRFTGYIFALAFWTKILTDAQCRELCRSPWSMWM